MTGIITTPSLNEIIQEAKEYNQSDKALNNVSSVAFWVKDRDFKFIRYNKGMLDILYPQAGDKDLKGLTDWEYAEKQGATPEQVEYVKNCCRFSDDYTLNSKNPACMFFERCQISGQGQIWLLTVKTRQPPEANKENCVGVCGFAFPLPNINLIIETGIIKTEKLSDSCYLLEE